MKKTIKFIACFILMFTCLITGFPIGSSASNLYTKTVHAAELNSTFTVKFMIVDSTNNYPGTSFKVSLEDVMGEASTEYEVKKAASWGNNSGNVPSISVAAPTTYNISISGLNDGYKLRDFMSGSDIESSFAATNNGEKTFYWEIVEGSAETTDNEGATVSAATATTNVVAENADAEKVYAEYLDTISFIKDDSTWSDMLNSYSSIPINVQVFGEIYSKSVNKGDKTEEDMMAEYETMPDFDKFLWVTTYLFMADKIQKGLPGDLTYEKMLENSACPIKMMQIGNKTDSDKVIAAYEKLLKWQADYIAANGSPFNFINNRSYLEEMGVSKVDTTAQDERVEEAKKEQEEIEKAVEELKEDEKEKDKGIWSDTLDILSSDLITILVLAVLLCGLGYVIYLKKKNNYTDEIHEK